MTLFFYLNIVAKLKQTLAKDVHAFADLDGHRAHDSPPATIPPNLVSMLARPNIAIICNQSVIILELTICGNNKIAMNKACMFKRNKPNYIQLIGDLERLGKPTKYVTIEIGALGHHSLQNREELARVVGNISELQWRSILDDAGKIAVNASHTIFLSRKSKSWHNPTYTYGVVALIPSEVLHF